jgi:SsrA-binding protein
MSDNKSQDRNLAYNKKARFNYEIVERLECGISLVGTEVKSIKLGKFSFTDAYAQIKENELWLIGFHISTYPFGNLFNHDPDRNRKLLVHKQEIKKLKRKVDEKGFTLVPTRFYLKRGRIKVELGIGRGKKTYDKRQDIKQRDQKRDAEREFRHRL